MRLVGIMRSVNGVYETVVMSLLSVMRLGNVLNLVSIMGIKLKIR